MLLDKQSIQQSLNQAGFHEQLELYVLESVDSTNRYVKDLTPSEELVLCCAETQTQGRGRFQRNWFSPHAENIYCSIRWHFPNPSNMLSTLSLVISLAILETLQSHFIPSVAPVIPSVARNLSNPANPSSQAHQDDRMGNPNLISIKWPNDLLWQDKKLCGILLETFQHPTIGLSVIIGIGLNVNSDSKAHPSENAPLKPWCSLYDITQNTIDRNKLIAQLLIHIHRYITQFKKAGFAPFLSQWQASDCLQGKTVEILQGNQIIRGVAQGINTEGELLVLDQNHVLWQIASGEASVLSRY